METRTAPCPRAAPACRDGCRAPACTSLPVRSPGLPAPPGNPQQSTGMATQSRRRPCASLFCFSAVKRPGPTGMQGFASVPGLPGALAWHGVVRAVRSPRRHGWEGLGVPGTPARTHQSNAGAILPAVQRVWHRDGCGGQRALLAAAPLCLPTGVQRQRGGERPRNGSSWCSPPWPGLGCAWKRRMRRSVQDGCSHPEGWGALGCPHSGPPSVPSRLDPLQG